MIEKRLVERLKQYWNTLKGEAIVPDLRRFNSDVISDLWPRCLMLEVVHNTANKAALYTYESMGADIIRAYGNDLTGHYVNVHMHNFPGWQVLKSIDDMLIDPKPHESEGSFISDAHKAIKYRAIILPFGNANRITHALVGLSWKEFG